MVLGAHVDEVGMKLGYMRLGWCWAAWGGGGVGLHGDGVALVLGDIVMDGNGTRG